MRQESDVKRTFPVLAAVAGIMAISAPPSGAQIRRPHQDQQTTSHLEASLFFVSGIRTEAADTSDIVVQKLGAHTYLITRDILEQAFAFDYTNTPNANPNWPRGAMIRLVVQWPDFRIPREGNGIFDRNIIITIISDTVGKITPNDQIIKNLTAAGLKPRLVPGEYGLMELHEETNDSGDGSEFFASPDQNTSFQIECGNDKIINNKVMKSSCATNFLRSDAMINIYFPHEHLGDWKEIYEQTVSLFDSMQRN